MPGWLRRVRGAVVVGLLWGGLAAVVGGFVMEAIVDPDGRIVDMWPQLLGIVGFLSGILFAAAVAIVGRHRRVDEFAYAAFAGLGALTGAGLGAALMLLTAAPLTLPIVTALGSAAAAALSLGIAKWASPTRLGSGRGSRSEALPRDRE